MNDMIRKPTDLQAVVLVEQRMNQKLDSFPTYSIHHNM